MRFILNAVPLDKCEERRLYRIHSRNLYVGVFDGHSGFIGIREKFGSKFLDTEIHHDAGGTVTVFEPIDLILHPGIDLKEGASESGQFVMNKALFDFLKVPDAIMGHKSDELWLEGVLAKGNTQSWVGKRIAHLHDN